MYNASLPLVVDKDTMEDEIFNQLPEQEANRRSVRSAAERELDVQLVADYKVVAEKYGARSEEASLAFEPIFSRYWPQVQRLANGKLGGIYADDLAAETLKTVWERLNGREIVTNLRGLVRHSFEREYATLLENLLQGRRLLRAQTNAENAAPEPVQGENGEAEPKRLKGAVVVSLNASAVGYEGDELELINLIEDSSADVVEAASHREHMRVLHQLMEEMPMQYRGPLVCQWLRGMKIKDVADELGLSIDQVKHNTARGIAWLRKKLPGEAADWLLN